MKKLLVLLMLVSTTLSNAQGYKIDYEKSAIIGNALSEISETELEGA